MYKDYWETPMPRYSHWQEGLPGWENYGKNVADLYERYWGATPRSIIDWGPGGGVVSRQLLARGVQTVIGVDISSTNLAEAVRVIDNPAFVARLISLPEDIQGAAPVQGIIASAVFHHFPDKAYARRVLRVMRTLVEEGGTALIQTRYDNGDPRFRYEPDQPYENNALTRCSWRIEEFWEELKRAGFSPNIVQIQESHNHAWYFCR